jgi:starch synthase
MPTIRVVMVAAEATPYVKVGGLADVAGALPRQLAKLGVDVEFVLPGYAAIDRGKYGFVPGEPLFFRFAGKEVRVETMVAVDAAGVRLTLIEDRDAFGRPGVYDDPATKQGYGDNPERFAFFSRAAAERVADAAPDVAHVHDAHAALVPAILSWVMAWRIHRRIYTVLTIHNLAYSMHAKPEVLFDIGFQRHDFFAMSPLEYFGHSNFLKTGIAFADAITTVSPRYAREIQDPELGCGLDGILRHRQGELIGILNGIDTDEWNPAKDPLIPARYDVDDLSGKRRCRDELIRAAGFKNGDAPIVGMVGRLVDQKGLDVFAAAVPQLMDWNVRFAILGSGQEKYHRLLDDLARARPDKFAVHLGFNNELAHRIEAGSDFFLMPSHFEPCGLNQMYSLRYGTIPIVRRTGGLADTVVDNDDARGRGTGFVFDQPSKDALLGKMWNAVRTWHDVDKRLAMIRRGMVQDFSVERSARRYVELYARLMSR